MGYRYRLSIIKQTQSEMIWRVGKREMYTQYTKHMRVVLAMNREKKNQLQ